MMVEDKPREMKPCPFCGGRAELMKNTEESVSNIVVESEGE